MKKGLSLGDLPSSLSVCCGPRGLERMSFGVSVPNPVLVDGWPSRETTEREISAMQNALSAMLGRPIAGTASLFPWGSVFAGFNERDVCAAAGLTYLLGS